MPEFEYFTTQNEVTPFAAAAWRIQFPKAAADIDEAVRFMKERLPNDECYMCGKEKHDQAHAVGVKMKKKGFLVEDPQYGVKAGDVYVYPVVTFHGYYCEKCHAVLMEIEKKNSTHKKIIKWMMIVSALLFLPSLAMQRWEIVQQFLFVSAFGIFTTAGLYLLYVSLLTNKNKKKAYRENDLTEIHPVQEFLQNKTWISYLL